MRVQRGKLCFFIRLFDMDLVYGVAHQRIRFYHKKFDLYERTYRIVFAWVSLEIKQREKNILFFRLLVCENLTAARMSTDLSVEIEDF